MNILVFNCGSSSLKYRLIQMPTEREIAGGEAQRIGPPTAEPSRIVHHENGARTAHPVAMHDHAAAFAEVMALLARSPDHRPDAVGHRLVHGGGVFPEDAIIDGPALKKLQSFQDLAPIHNPPAIALAQACTRLDPQLPQVAVFDTAYHSTIPDCARTYALPRTLREDLGLRKYGFHGTSHRYVAQEAAKFLQIPLAELNAVSCHLGSGGASLCAIVRGRSVDNTMGYSPLQGLVMSTRCGDLDPGIALALVARADGDRGAVETLLNRHSGVLALSGGVSADIRDVLAAPQDDSPASRQLELTRQIYLWRLRKYLGAYLAVVPEPAAIIFTDTIGETVPEVRWAVCAGLESFGVQMDPARNRTTRTGPTDVATPESPVRILVILTNEELSIARATWRMVVPAA